MSRITEASNPSLNPSLSYMESTPRIFYVDSLQSMSTISDNYALDEGNLAILHDTGNMPSKIYSWCGSITKWQELSTISNPGPILLPGTEEEKGIVQFAKDKEEAPLLAVQANDSRLKQWVASATPPSNLNVLWLDTSNSLPIIKWYNGLEWIPADNKKIIVDISSSLNTTYSSEKINNLLNLKAEKDHTHLSCENHIANKNNPHEVKASQISDFQSSVSMNNTVVQNAAARHSHNNISVLNNLSTTSDSYNLIYNGKQLGYGDMKSSIYDTDNDGIIDSANKIVNQGQIFDAVRLLKTEAKSHSHTNIDTLNNTTAVFTSELLSKLNSIEDGANKYTLPSSLSPNIITQDEFHRFVSDAQLKTFNDKYTKSEIDSLVNLKEDKINKGIANGYASLDRNGMVPVSQLPLSIKETQVVKTISDRNLMTKYTGLRVVVLDASSDPLVGAGIGEYVWDGSSWYLISTAPRKSVMSNSIAQIVSGTENDRLTNPPKDDILFLAEDSKKIYLYIHGNCIMFASNNSSVPGINKIQESFVLKAGQTIVTLLQGTYTPLDDNIDLFIDGIVQPKEAFNEINNRQIQLKQPIDEDCNITLEYISEY